MCDCATFRSQISLNEELLHRVLSHTNSNSSQMVQKTAKWAGSSSGSSSRFNELEPDRTEPRNTRYGYKNYDVIRVRAGYGYKILRNGFGCGYENYDVIRVQAGYGFNYCYPCRTLVLVGFFIFTSSQLMNWIVERIWFLNIL